MDIFSKEKRSEVMSKICSSETKFEKKFIAGLRKRTNKKFKINVREIKGKPDIFFEKQKLCVFLDSDFWHGWQYPRWEKKLKNDFWKNKIENTRKRDKKNTACLRRAGWKVLRIWGHQIEKQFDEMVNKVLHHL